MTDEPGARRRSRRRATAREGPPRADRITPDPAPDPMPEPARPQPATPPAARTKARGRKPAAKKARGDGDLAGSGSSQVGPTGAMRARELNRPTAEDLAEAEAGLEIVRRHWTPTPGQPEQPDTHRRR